MIESCSNPTEIMSRWRRASVVVLSVAAAFAVGCVDSPEEPARAVPRVKVFEVGETTLGQVRTLSGEVAAGTASPLSFGVSGTVDKVLVSRGASVAPGDLLATLDSTPLRLSFDQARAELSAARAKLEEAEQAYARASSLLAGRGITQAEYESATSQVRSERASLRSAQSRAEQAERDLGRTCSARPSRGGSQSAAWTPSRRSARTTRPSSSRETPSSRSDSRSRTH
jgi:multidrug efflux pump subunit AcrA (membrane-fusion protein)